jgi:ATP-dependent DNA ligase
MRRKGVMLARKFEPKRLEKWPMPVIVQPKINGRRALAVFGKLGKPMLLSSEGHIINSLPSLIDSLSRLGLSETILDGELYNHDWSFQKLCSVVGRTRDLHEEEAQVQYWAFDVKNEQPQENRLGLLNRWLSNWTDERIVRVQHELAYEPADLDWCLDYYTTHGFEGIILRHIEGLYQELRSDWMMKLKPRKLDNFVIVGVTEEMSIYNEPKDALGALILRTNDGQTFKCGTGFTREQREEYWFGQNVINHRAQIYYQELSDRGVPIFPVFRKLL